MAAAHPPDEPLSPEQWQEREAVLDRFEAAWQRGERPVIDAFRPAGGAGDGHVLTELVQSDLEYRLKAGEPACALDYLARYPELATDAAALVELAVTEYELRRRRGEPLDPAEYARHFPGHDAALLPRLHAFAADVPAASLPGYEILGELGRGGMGVVYKARQLSLNRPVALKMILAALHAGPGDTARLRREAEAAARLQHAHIVQVYEVGEHAGRPFLAMEYVEGGSLAQRFAGTPPPPDQAARLVQTLARAMHAAHQKGIIHRDLKPANILLTRDGAPKITDFGLAKQLEAEAQHTQSGTLLGTPAYMAPEQAAGKARDVSPRTDVYALGAILYDLLTGRPPFRADTPLATLRQVLDADPVPPRRLQPHVPDDLETICLKCLRKDAARRYASAEELADDLGRFLAGEPIRARPVGLAERAVKWARRRPARAALLAVCALGLLGLAAGGIGFTVYLQRALDQRTDELRAEQQARERDAAERQQRREQELKEGQYTADLRLAAQAWQKARWKEAHDLLLRQRPAGPAEDLRDFAWHYLWGQCGRERQTLQGHAQPVQCAAYSPDGRTLAAGTRGGQVILWDAATGRELAVLAGHAGGVEALAFSADGSTLACTAHFDNIKLWNVARRQVSAVVPNSRDAVAVAFAPRGERLAASFPSGLVTLWDLSSPAEAAVKFLNAGRQLSLCFAPDGKMLLGAQDGGDVYFWDAATGKKRGPDLRLDEPIYRAALSPDGRTLAAAGESGAIQLWDLHWRVRRGVMQGHRGRVLCVAFSPDGRLLASGGGDATVRLWDPTSGRPRGVLAGHRGLVAAVAFAPDGRTLASASADQTVKLWDPAPRPACVGLGVEPAAVGPLAHAPDGKTLAVAAGDRSVALLDAASGQVLARLRGHCEDLTGVAFTHDGRTLATADAGGAVFVWDVARRQQRLLFSAGGGRRVAFSPDGRWLAAATPDRAVSLWDLAAGTRRATLPGHTAEVTALAFAPDGTTLLTGCRDGVLKHWDVPAGKERRSVQDRGGAVLALAFAPDGLTFASAHLGLEIRLWDAASGAFRTDLGIDRPKHTIDVLAFSPDGTTLVSGGDEHEVRFWDVRRRTLSKTIRYSPGPTRGLSFSSDGQTLAVATGDAGLRLWDCRRWTLRKPPGQPPRPVRALAFAQDGQTLVTGSGTPPWIGLDPVTWGGPVPAVRTDLGRLKWEDAKPEGDHLRAWDVASGRERDRLRGRQTFGVEALLAAASPPLLLAGGMDGSISPWDLATGRAGPPAFLDAQTRAERQTWERVRSLGLPMTPDFKEAAWRMALSPDGRLLAVAGNHGTVKLWQLPGLREEALLQPRSDTPACVAFSPDGTTLALSTRGEIQLWDVAGRRLRDTLVGQREPVLALAFAPDGQTLASGTYGWHVTLWDVAGRRPQAILTGHRAAVSALAFSPNGKTLASGSWDGTVKLWRTARGEELLTLEGHTGRIHAVAFSPDGRTLASGGESSLGGGEVCLWRAAPDVPTPR
jgi:WD40 repeat protein/predicted Ser/Thr protein kinase